MRFLNAVIIGFFAICLVIACNVENGNGNGNNPPQGPPYGSPHRDAVADISPERAQYDAIAPLYLDMIYLRTDPGQFTEEDRAQLRQLYQDFSTRILYNYEESDSLTSIPIDIRQVQEWVIPDFARIVEGVVHPSIFTDEGRDAREHNLMLWDNYINRLETEYGVGTPQI